MARAGVWSEISGGNLRNGHIYLRKIIDFFPSDAIGGTNADDASPHHITVEFSHGETVSSDIDGDKLFLRTRGAVKRFFAATGAVEGDRVFIRKTASSPLIPAKAGTQFFGRCPRPVSHRS